MIEVIKESYPDIHFGGYYIIAPENPCSGYVNPDEWDEVWQYGTDEKNDAKWLQDGVAPRCRRFIIGGLLGKRKKNR